MTDLESRSEIEQDSRSAPDSPVQADVEAGLVRRLSIVSLLPLVAIGGAVGAVARWGVQHLAIELGGAMVGALLLVNLLGSFLLGYVFTRIDARYPSLIDIDLPPGYEPGRRPAHPILAAAVIGGSLGAFTTYSSLCLEVIRLWDDGNPYRIELDDADGTNVWGPIDDPGFVRARPDGK